DPDDLLELLREFFRAMDLNPDHISEPNDWSRITSYEGYIRVHWTESAAHFTGDGGLIQQLAKLGMTDRERGNASYRLCSQHSIAISFGYSSLDRPHSANLLPQPGSPDSGATHTCREYVVFIMSSSIRISEETKRKLEARKREGESFDDLLERLARTEKDVEEMAGFADEGIGEHMKEKREELNESLEERTERLE
ncbi:MAG: antitoxin VapB family protein, partial [Salinirussus sp.]